jgi:hypothetical protein
LDLKISLAWPVRKLILDSISWSLGLVAVASASAGWLIHVKPNTVELNLLVELLKLTEPPLLGLILEEIRVVSMARPHTTGGGGGHIRFQDENFILKALLICLVVLAWSHSDGIVNDRNKLAALRLDLIDLLRKISIALLRVCEDLVVIHVIDIAPHGVERNAKILVLLIGVPPDLRVVVSELALVPAESPHGWHSLEAGHSLVLKDDFLNVLALEEDLVDHSTDGDLGDLGDSVVIHKGIIVYEVV